MQTVETLNEGLKRAYTLTIPASEIAAKVDAEVKKAAPQVRMPGFRPGKVPANLIKKMHGPALERDALNTAVQDGVQSLMTSHGLRPATQPEVQLDQDYAPGKDVEVKVSLEVLPQVPAPQIEGLTLERLTVEPDESAVDTQVERFASQRKSFTDAMEGHPAVSGDQVVIDFIGRTEDGVAFPGGTGEDMAVELGSGQLIPGFEEQMEGVKVGDTRTLNVTFPEAYQEKSLAGKPATFEITVKAVKVPGEQVIDDEFAKGLGLESLEQLRGIFKGQQEQELNGLTRTYMKRKLLDQLADAHDFDVPPSMVEQEFQQIWRQLEHEATHESDPEAAKAEMEAERDDYRKIAERRVRLGLLLSEIGQQNGVEVTSAEMQRLAAQAAQQYAPKDRQRFLEYVQQDPVAAAQLRAPLYEDKVVDFLFGKAEISDRTVSREELEAAIEADDGFSTGTHMHSHDHDHDHDHSDHDHGHDHDGHDHGDHDHGDHDHDHAGHDHDHAGHDHDHAHHDHAMSAPAEAAETATEVKDAAAKKAAPKRKKAEATPAADDAEAVAEVEAPKKRARARKADSEPTAEQ